MLQAEVMRGVVHQSHQLFAFVDDGSTGTPGKYSGKKTCDLYILFFRKQMRNGNRIVFYKKRLIVGFYFVI